MRKHNYFLADHPVEPYFPYIAIAPWPHLLEQPQLDWVDCVATLEHWLVAHVGSHYSHWCYATQQEQEYWQACVAFRREQDKLLFLLRWR